MGYSGDGGKLIHEKKSRDTVPLRRNKSDEYFVFIG
jgi:hypothetical protein